MTWWLRKYIAAVKCYDSSDESSNESSGEVSDDEPDAVSDTEKDDKVKKADNYKHRSGIRKDLDPLYTLDEIFEDMTTEILKHNFSQFLTHLNGRALNMATMCSGTESPVIALSQVGLGKSYPNKYSLVLPDRNIALKRLNIEKDLHINHIFSAEIVPFKQAYLQTNFNPDVIFRNITELSKPWHDESKPREA